MRRFSPLHWNSYTLENRIVVPPMASQTASTDGFVTQDTITHYRNLSRSGAGLIMVEYSFVNESGRSEVNQLGAHKDDCIQGMASIAEAIHESGAKAGFQLTHCGGKAQLDVCPDLMGPSGITVPAYDRTLPKPRDMGTEDIHQWHRDFVAAAVRVEQAGFDFVELHCAHGYGLNQVLSPITNQRSDQYGGSLENRARLIVDIIRSIRQATSLGIMVRIPGQDLYPEGLSQADMSAVCRMFVAAGVSIIDVSSGIGGWNRPKDRRGEGYLVSESEYLKSQDLGVPVIGVGGIESSSFMELALEQERLDLIAVGRAILRGPIQFSVTNMINPENTSIA